MKDSISNFYMIFTQTCIVKKLLCKYKMIDELDISNLCLCFSCGNFN